MDIIRYMPEDLQDHHGVAAIIYDGSGQVLMQEHVKYGFWTIPAGKVKPGQNIENALREEIWEECNITLLEYREVRCRTFHYLRAGRDVAVISHLFEVDQWQGNVRNKEPHKHRRMLFLPVAQIAALHPLSDLTQFFLEYLSLKRT